MAGKGGVISGELRQTEILDSSGEGSISSSASSKGTFKPKPPAPGRPKKKKKGEEDSEEKKDRPVAVRYHCDYCRKDISNVVRIKCAECNDFDLCIECFSVGVEISTHKNNHNYQVIDHMKFTLFSEDWGADEELLLLEAIETYGLGNWTDVADHVGTKTLSQCETHYFNLYFHPSLSSLPLPDMRKMLVVEREPKEVLPQLEQTIVQKQKPGASGPIQHEGSGLMAYRGEFEVEYENDAEAPLAEMTISRDEDTDQEIELKTKVLLAYNQKLHERYAKRKFVIENLLDLKKRPAHSHHHHQQQSLLLYPNIPLSKEEKSVNNMHRVFLQLWTRDQHDSFLRGLIAEKQLLEKISELQNYRVNGITTLIDAESFESDIKKKELDLGKTNSLYGSSTLSQKWLKRERDSTQDAKKKKMRKINETNENIRTWITGGSNNTTTGSTKPKTKSDDGWGLLSSAEIELCSSIKVQWDQYLIVKEALLREYLKYGNIKKSNARQISKIDMSKMGCIFDYLESAGIINANHT